MKVAEALALRADLQRRLEQLKQRLVKNARVSRRGISRRRLQMNCKQSLRAVPGS
jgi:hypothetical protein